MKLKALRVVKTVLYSLLLVSRIQLSCGWIFLANSDQEQTNAPKPSPYYRGTVTEEGVTYEYEYANGKLMWSNSLNASFSHQTTLIIIH